MEQIWYNRILEGTHYLSDVPDLWLDKVIELIEKNYFNGVINKGQYTIMMKSGGEINSGLKPKTDIIDTVDSMNIDDVIDEYLN